MSSSSADSAGCEIGLTACVKAKPFISMGAMRRDEMRSDPDESRLGLEPWAQHSQTPALFFFAIPSQVICSHAPFMPNSWLSGSTVERALSLAVAVMEEGSSLLSAAADACSPVRC